MGEVDGPLQKGHFVRQAGVISVMRHITGHGDSSCVVKDHAIWCECPVAYNWLGFLYITLRTYANAAVINVCKRQVWYKTTYVSNKQYFQLKTIVV